jgi:hypothetical protein
MATKQQTWPQVAQVTTRIDDTPHDVPERFLVKCCVAWGKGRGDGVHGGVGVPPGAAGCLATGYVHFVRCDARQLWTTPQIRQLDGDEARGR